MAKACRSIAAARSTRAATGLRAASAPARSIAARCAPFDTGVRALNALTTFGIGQRIGIMAGSGVGKSVLLDMIAHGAEAEIVVVGLIGERAREVSDFVERHMNEARSANAPSSSPCPPIMPPTCACAARCWPRPSPSISARRASVCC
jgi:flagellar biosynthesis/type III secretory pathway ATPase